MNQKPILYVPDSPPPPLSRFRTELVWDGKYIETIAGFWNVLKRGIDGVCHAVSEKHLQGYINEYSFGYNHHEDEKPMFKTVLEKI